MNERIQELVKQVNGQVTEYVNHSKIDNNQIITFAFHAPSDHMVSAYPDHYHGRFIEKFAELIVKECANIVSDAVDHREPASTYVGKIKEHFGVE